MNRRSQPHQQQYQQQSQFESQEQIVLAHNGQNNHNQRRNSKVPVRELPPAMPAYQNSIYPELYTVKPSTETCYKWECIILDLDRTIIHGKRLSVKRWRKYVENGTIPSLAENQCGKWHRHIHRKGHQMHPFIRGRTMIYYRPFTWHLLAVLDYLKTHFGTKIIVCTKAGEHYAASVLAALISNFTSGSPDLIDDVYNFHDLHDDAEEEGKPKKAFRLICNRHEVDPSKTLIVDDNATSWFDEDRKITNFWMPPCYGYQIHDIDNELQLLCKYLWDPIQQNHLKRKMLSNASNSNITNITKQQTKQSKQAKIDDRSNCKSQAHYQEEVQVQVQQEREPYQDEEEEEESGNCNNMKMQMNLKLKVMHNEDDGQLSDSAMEHSTLSPGSSVSLKREIMSYVSPKSVSSSTGTASPKAIRYLLSPNNKSVSYSRSVSVTASPRREDLLHYPGAPGSCNNYNNYSTSLNNMSQLSNSSLQFSKSVSSSCSIISNDSDSVCSHNKLNDVQYNQYSQYNQYNQNNQNNQCNVYNPYNQYPSVSSSCSSLNVYHNNINGTGGNGIIYDDVDESRGSINSRSSRTSSMIIGRISRGYNKRKYKEQMEEFEQIQQMQQLEQIQASVVPSSNNSYGNEMEQYKAYKAVSMSASASATVSATAAVSTKRNSVTKSSSSTKTKKKKSLFFESKARGSKKLAKIIGK